jgi:hypothetical protein
VAGIARMKRAMYEPEISELSVDPSIDVESDRPAIAVIVPVWNGEETIAGTVNALLMSDMVGSMRSSSLMTAQPTERLQVLAGFGERIRVVSRTNGGPAAARNTGIAKWPQWI